MKKVEGNGETNEEFVVDRSEKRKTERQSQQDLEKVEITEGKEQQQEETTVQKEYHNMSKNLINKGMESKMTRNKITYDIGLNEQEST